MNEEIVKAINLLVGVDFKGVPEDVMKRFVEKAEKALGCNLLVADKIGNRVLIKNENGSTSKQLDCGEECPFSRECGQHRTAGEFRGEDGMTPDVAWVDNKWDCSKTETNKPHGAIVRTRKGEFMTMSDYRWSDEV